MTTEINHRKEVDERIDDWMLQEKNQPSLERLQNMNQEELVRTCVHSWIKNDALFQKEVDRFVEHSPKTQEKILAAIKDKPELDHSKIAHAVARSNYRNAQSFRAGEQQGKGATFMARFKQNAVEQAPSQTQEQALTR